MMKKAKKRCAGKGCKNEAELTLKVKVVERGGSFCTSCAAYLMLHDLVEAA